MPLSQYTTHSLSQPHENSPFSQCARERTFVLEERDLFTWIGAVAATIGYKLAVGHAPFPADESSVQTMSIAGAWDEVMKLKDMPPSAQIANGVEAEESEGSKIMGAIGTVIKLSATGAVAAADYLVPMAPLTGVLGIGQKALKKVNFSKLVVQDARGLGAVLDAVLAISSAAVTAWHLYELSQKSKSEKQATAITSEVGKVTKYISRLAYAVAVNDEEEVSRQIAIVAMAVGNLVYAGALFTEAGLGGQAIS
ncbi:hypothetical protein CNMCM8980_002507 [Aspergillus fumigatiaffinis]|uniref:Uncharacterized protein n=1 Tax=Aspergillus fumigatiaffinis TaxID=340414 RepID=A0A8H4H2B3_9EURO|nr:hypothetical protein CNMCM5878_009246 [Aspergillus fumigatiaffinis]KAF4233430.1 hypothetical protein CNMCM6805_009197 [Aspergillus fumigatiaffinis]KAF4249801.1 hypothetical protein CNMCM8980_002507 [Aspergillus fumigatiaffinis]